MENSYTANCKIVIMQISLGHFSLMCNLKKSGSHYDQLELIKQVKLIRSVLRLLIIYSYIPSLLITLILRSACIYKCMKVCSLKTVIVCFK